MTQWDRLQRWILGQPSNERPFDEDPELLLTRASEEMRVTHAKNRERAVQAITQKNNLQAMVEETRRRVDALQAKADLALARGDDRLALRIFQEKDSYDQTLQLTQAQLELAIQTSEQVKEAIRREDEKIRRKTAETLALKTQWKLIQVEQALTISLAQISAGGMQATTRVQIQERHRRNRELVVEAMTQKNFLEALASETRIKAEDLRARADSARREGDEDAERQLLRELEQHEATLASTEAALHQAIQVTNRARTLFDEESVHFQTLNLTETPTDISTRVRRRSVERRRSQNRSFQLRTLALAVVIALVLVLIALLFG